MASPGFPSQGLRGQRSSSACCRVAQRADDEGETPGERTRPDRAAGDPARPIASVALTVHNKSGIRIDCPWHRRGLRVARVPHSFWVAGHPDKIGSASCRERGCTYVLVSVGAVSLKKKK